MQLRKWSGAEVSQLQIASQHHITGWPDAPESVAG
jgi:hypothetical protein